jgi:TPR repeat protein
MVAKKNIFFIIILVIMSIITFFIVSRLLVSKSSDDTRMIPHLNYSLIIPENELSQKALDALAGDPDAAFALAIHYGGGFFKLDEAIEWHTISAENENYISQYGLASYVISTTNDEKKMRGVFWLYMLAKDNYRETKDWLEEIGYSLDTAQPPDDRNFPSNYSQLSESDIDLCRKGALQGNKKVALLLGEYYKEIEVDRELSKYWYRIGAQNGSLECQYILSQILLAEDDELAQIRGQFWLRKTKENASVADTEKP